MDELLQSSLRNLDEYKNLMEEWYEHINEMITEGIIIKNVVKVQCYDKSDGRKEWRDVVLFYYDDELYAVECPECNIKSIIRIYDNNHQCDICGFSLSLFRCETDFLEMYMILESYK